MGTETGHESFRRQVLSEAAELIDGDRNADYGDPIDDFRRTAGYWNIHIGGVARRVLIKDWGYSADAKVTVDTFLSMLSSLLDPHDVAIMMGQLKDSRLAWSPQKEDHWVDKAGYAGCGFDCIKREHGE